MLIIRQAQMAALDEGVRQQFEDEMLRHSGDFAPILTTVLGQAQSRVAVRRAIARARDHGLTLRGPIRLFVELSFLFGSGFDSDPQYPWARDILARSLPEMERAEALHASTLEYQQRVSGSGGRNTRRALVELLQIAGRPVSLDADTVGDVVRAEMLRAFPEKVSFIGDAALDALVAHGQAVAAEVSFPGRGQAVLIALMFAFGAGCSDDPLYPWIAATLRDPRIISAELRARRLERKSRTWLRHVVASMQEESGR